MDYFTIAIMFKYFYVCIRSYVYTYISKTALLTDLLKQILGIARGVPPLIQKVGAQVKRYVYTVVCHIVKIGLRRFRHRFLSFQKSIWLKTLSIIIVLVQKRIYKFEPLIMFVRLGTPANRVIHKIIIYMYILFMHITQCD